MVAKKKRRAAADPDSAVDYKAKYNDLSDKVKTANAGKKEMLSDISKSVAQLLKGICEPTPPGCSGSSRPKESFEEFCVSVQQANSNKRDNLMYISDQVKKLMQKICDPVPPGC